jgi:hypothetical protein
MTPEDAEQITAIVAAAEQRITTTLATTLTGTVAASEQRTAQAIGQAIEASEQRTAEAFAAAEQRTAQAIAAAKDQTVEALRDMQTEMLRGIEAFARGNFARLHRIETSDADTNTRISALEERVLYLETRRPIQ